jgi:hypothetical protein
MAEKAAAARGKEDGGAVAPCGQDKTGGRERASPHPHPMLIEMARMLARAEAKRLQS